ncbi:hypothetical protein ACFTAO_31145 [Paenibacillus rhizoplanae]
MKPKDVMSLSADLFSDLPVQYNVVMVEQSKDPVAELPYLPVLDIDGVHTRGTFPDSTRIMNVTDLVGTTQSKLLLGDNIKDKNLDGIDPMKGTYVSNAGNFGVLYKNRTGPCCSKHADHLQPARGVLIWDRCL